MFSFNLNLITDARSVSVDLFKLLSYKFIRKVT